MARVKLSEHKTKSLLYAEFGLPYYGHSVTRSDIPSLSPSSYVVKVDQGVKKRYKQGLVFLDVKSTDTSDACHKLFEKGFDTLLIEPYITHEQQSERYLALERVREGILLYYSPRGGVDIESQSGSIQKVLLTDTTEIEDIPHVVLKNILNFFEKNYVAFLELNPFLLNSNEPLFLDAACEVDSTAEFFVDGRWTQSDIVTHTGREETEEEKNIKNLAAKSPAAFSLTILNENGSIGMLLSSGGASIVTADEVGSRGMGNMLLNYGEYSGGPTQEETYIYAKNILSLLLKSSAPKKVLLITGGVANFTDIRITFRGVIHALDEVKEALREQKIKVFVRRGGPRQKEGLSLMQEFLEKEGLYGYVDGPTLGMDDIVEKATTYLETQ